MKTLVILLLAFLGIFNSVYAQDIVLSTNQTDYYFSTGENAMIPIQINNTYGKQISGNLQYTMSQQINQGNMQLSNSNSEEKSLSIDKENSNVSLNLGKSDSPSDYTVNINYNYNANGDRVVSLGPISVHFVSSKSGNTQGPQMHSSSQPNNRTQTRAQDLFSQQQQMEQELNKMLGNPQDLFSQQQQQMEQELNNMTGNSQNQSQNHQQQLQNNQLSQDSNALKQQLEKQVQKQEQVKNEFEKKLFSNNVFLSKHQKLLKDGFNISNSDLNPVTNDTGTFNIKYNNTIGKLATLQGNMNNGTVTHINEQNQVEQEKLLERLKQNTQYQKFNDKLLKEGFAQNNATIEAKSNQTDIILKYSNQKHDNASIEAEFISDNLKQVTLNDGNSNQFNWILLLIIVATIVGIGIICIYLAIKKIIHKDKSVENTSLVTKPKSLDYITESKKLMYDAVAHHNKGQYEEAFETAGKALRFFLTADAGIKKETTTQELIHLLQKNKYPLDDIIDCFEITDLVEFARHKPTETDFDKIVSLFNKLSDKINHDDKSDISI